jgi:hypothetical protein
MRSRPKQSTPQEIATNKRLRLLCLKLAEIAGTVTPSETAESIPDKLPQRIVDLLNVLNADRADLMAIRQTPFKWNTRPYDWLWMLHRYQNQYQQR